MSAVVHSAAPAIGTPSGTRSVTSPITPAWRRTPTRRPLGDPTALICTVSRIAVDVVQGESAIDQLSRWVSSQVRDRLLTQQTLTATGTRISRGPSHVHRVRLCRVSAGAVEAAIVVTKGGNAHAVAMRLEAIGGRWLITVIDVG